MSCTNEKHNNEDGGHGHHGEHNASNEYMHRRGNVAELIKRFDDPARDEWQRPEWVLDQLEQLSGKTVVDIGSGSGCFSFLLAERGARVIAADVNEDFQEHIRQRAAAESISNLTPRKVDYDDPKLTAEEADLILIVNTFHHMDERMAYLGKLLAGTKPGGRLAIVDYKKMESPNGPPTKLRVSASDVQLELLRADYTDITVDSTSLPEQYLITAQKPSDYLSATKAKWNKWFGDTTYIYGREPNVFYAQTLAGMSPGQALFAAEGEGRNAVYAALNGWDVDAFDLSESGREKTMQLASKAGVDVNYRIANFADPQLAKEKYDLVAFIYSHVPSEVWSAGIPKIIASLRPGGTVILELFSEKHAESGSSYGPKSKDYLFSAKKIKATFQNFKIELLEEVPVDLEEGFHSGAGEVVRFIGRKQ